MNNFNQLLENSSKLKDEHKGVERHLLSISQCVNSQNYSPYSVVDAIDGLVIFLSNVFKREEEWVLTYNIRRSGSLREITNTLMTALCKIMELFLVVPSQKEGKALYNTLKEWVVSYTVRADAIVRT